MMYLCNVMKKYLFLVAFFVSLVAYSQEKHAQMDSAGQVYGSLGDWLKNGELDFHVRNFFMATRNKGALLNYFSLATGAGLGYYSPSFKGFHVGFSGFFVFQLHEHNLRIADPVTGNVNRYEILLYDMNDLENTRDLDRLEHLYLSYLNDGFQAVFGRQSVNTPFLNEQDNRMRPNTFSGLTLRYTTNDWDIYGGGFTHVTMRGTVDWYSIEESFGVYPFGRNPLGEPSSYKENISSSGIGMLGVSRKLNEKGSLHVYNYWAENVFNTTFAQSDWKFGLEKQGLQVGLQGFYQTPTGGGNENPSTSFIMSSEQTYGIGGKAGWYYGNHAWSINFLGISDSGRFLFPREWGRERFYASLPRERFEGNGGVRAITAKYDWKGHNNWRGALGASTVKNPDINNYGLNKYGVPSYYHFVGELDYEFDGFLQGMDLRFMVVNKTAQRPNQVPDRYRINRVDMWNFNLIMDYRF